MPELRWLGGTALLLAACLATPSPAPAPSPYLRAALAVRMEVARRGLYRAAASICWSPGEESFGSNLLIFFIYFFGTLLSMHRSVVCEQSLFLNCYSNLQQRVEEKPNLAGDLTNDLQWSVSEIFYDNPNSKGDVS